MSHIFLVQMMFIFIFIIAGLLAAEVDSFPLTRITIFCLIFVILFSLSFHYIKNLTWLVTGVLLFAISILFHSALSEYTPVRDQVAIHFRVLQKNESGYIIEINEKDMEYSYYKAKGESVIPYISRLDFSQFLFFMPASTYINFHQLVQGSDQIDDSLLHLTIPAFLYISSQVSTEPISNELLSRSTYIIKRDGSIRVENTP